MELKLCNYKISPNYYLVIKILAATRGTTASQLITDALEEYFLKHYDDVMMELNEQAAKVLKKELNSREEN